MHEGQDVNCVPWFSPKHEIVLCTSAALRLFDSRYILTVFRNVNETLSNLTTVRNFGRVSRGIEGQRLRSVERPRDSKTKIRSAEVGSKPEAKGRTQLHCFRFPAAAAEHD
jgi:hypothetical protein